MKNICISSFALLNFVPNYANVFPPCEAKDFKNGENIKLRIT